MRKIGLIGGMSFEATSVYYRKINEAVRDQLGGFNAAEILIDSVNFNDIVVLQKSASGKKQAAAWPRPRATSRPAAPLAS